MVDRNELIERFDEQEKLATARWADPAYIADKYQYEPGAIWLGRNPHNPDEAIGYKDDRHVFLNAETRGGKGRSILVNNQVLWPGSMIAIGPKGEEATITATRRGQGDEYCTNSLGQDVYVLDPMRCADVPEEYRAHFDLLSGLDPNDDELAVKCDQRANAICKIADSGESKEWGERGREWLSVVMQHVITTPAIEDKDKDERNIITVRRFIMRGDEKLAGRIYKAARMRAEQNGEDPNTVEEPNPMLTLLNDMIRNKACRGNISDNAADLLQSYRNNIRLFDSVRKSAADHLKWLVGGGIQSTVKKSEKYPRTFDPADIKNKRISVFIHLPEANYDPLDRWLRCMVVTLLQNLQETQGLPANGERVLFCIDEFANLGEMDMVSKAMNSIAGAGVKMMITTQRLGDLEELYGKAWEKFISAAGTQIFFSVEELSTRRYLEEKLGKTEIVKYARQAGGNTSASQASGETQTYTHTNSMSSSSTTSTNTSTSKGTSQGTNWSKSKNWGRNRYKSKNTGDTAAKNYTPGLFFDQGDQLGFNESETDGRGWGSGKNKGRSKTVGGNTGTSTQVTTGHSESEQTGRSTSDAQSQGTTFTYTDSEGQSWNVTESYHTKPLLSGDELKRYLLPVKELDHAAYPGMALIFIAEEKHPFFVRRSNYDQDPFFIGKFSDNPAHQYLSYDEQPLLGWQITPEHFLTISPPTLLVDFEIEINSKLKNGEIVKPSEPLFSYEATPQHKPLSGEALEEFNNQVVTDTVYAKYEFKVIEQFDHQNDQALILRANKPLNEEDVDKIEEDAWLQLGDYAIAYLLLFEQEKKEKERVAREKAEAEAQQRKEEDERNKRALEEEKTAKKEAKIAAAIFWGVIVLLMFTGISIFNNLTTDVSVSPRNFDLKIGEAGEPLKFSFNVPLTVKTTFFGDESIVETLVFEDWISNLKYRASVDFNELKNSITPNPERYTEEYLLLATIFSEINECTVYPNKFKREDNGNRYFFGKDCYTKDGERISKKLKEASFINSSSQELKSFLMLDTELIEVPGDSGFYVKLIKGEHPKIIVAPKKQNTPKKSYEITLVNFESMIWDMEPYYVPPKLFMCDYFPKTKSISPVNEVGWMQLIMDGEDCYLKNSRNESISMSSFLENKGLVKKLGIN